MAPVVLVDSTMLENVNREIVALYEKMEYRPVIVQIVQNSVGQLLFLHSTKGPYWGFPQGGVDRGEDVIDALVRELREETGIGPEEITVHELCHLDRIDISDRKRSGFSKGKRYFYFFVKREREGLTVLQPSEADDYRWVLPSEVPDLIKEVGEAKRNSMLAAITKLQTPQG